jgi:prepilin-type N-terminal cleavage/methylation domain-containing protein/prepilin-type processing-associated H-X9-DG protein
MNTPNKKLRRQEIGFTLVELLAVIAIVGVLAAILISVVGSMRATAKTTVCMSNMRQLGVGTQLYLVDNQNVMYPHSVNQGQYFWHHFLRPYVGKAADGAANREALYCPYILDTRPNSQTEFRYTGYGKNANLGRTESSPSGVPGLCKKITPVYPTEKVVLFWDDKQETNFDGGWPKSLSYWQGAWYSLAFRHKGKSHIVFLDAHVESVAAGPRGDARDYPQFLWGPFPDYPDAPVRTQP